MLSKPITILAPMPAPRTVPMPTDHLQLEIVSIIRIRITKADPDSRLSSQSRTEYRSPCKIAGRQHMVIIRNLIASMSRSSFCFHYEVELNNSAL